MICPECRNGMVYAPPAENNWMPCPRCNGSGIAYCCDGENYNSACHDEHKPGEIFQD